MKKLLLIPALVVFAFCATAALVQIQILPSASVNATASSNAPVAIGVAYFSPFTLFVQNNGLTSTGALSVSFNLFISNNTVGVYVPNGTAPTNEPFALTNSSFTIYLQAVVTTTNNVTNSINVVKTQ